LLPETYIACLVITDADCFSAIFELRPEVTVKHRSCTALQKSIAKQQFCDRSFGLV